MLFSKMALASCVLAISPAVFAYPADISQIDFDSDGGNVTRGNYSVDVQSGHNTGPGNAVFIIGNIDYLNSFQYVVDAVANTSAALKLTYTPSGGVVRTVPLAGVAAGAGNQSTGLLTFDFPVQYSDGFEIQFLASGPGVHLQLLNFDVTPPVPEPETYALLAAGLALMSLMVRRQPRHRAIQPARMGMANLKVSTACAVGIGFCSRVLEKLSTIFRRFSGWLFGLPIEPQKEA